MSSLRAMRGTLLFCCLATAAFFAVTLLGGCSGCVYERGGFGEGCYPNSTCDADLVCVRVPQEDGYFRDVCSTVPVCSEGVAGGGKR